MLLGLCCIRVGKEGRHYVASAEANLGPVVRPANEATRDCATKRCYIEFILMRSGIVGGRNLVFSAFANAASRARPNAVLHRDAGVSGLLLRAVLDRRPFCTEMQAY